MSNLPGRYKFLIDLMASFAAKQYSGLPGIIQDMGYRFAWYAGGLWRWAAPGDADGNVKATAVYVSNTERITPLGKVFATDIEVSSLTSGKYALAGADGLLGDGALSEDATSVKSVKPLALNGATRPAWALWDAPIQLSGLAAIYTITGSGGQVGFARNFYVNSAGEKRAIVSGSGVGYPSQFHIDDNGRIRFYASQTNPVAGAAVADMNLRFEVNRFGGVGFFGVAAPATRPTISGQRLGSPAIAALYQALGLTGLILDATTRTSVQREAIIQPLPITNAAPGVVTVVSGGMKSFGFDGGASTEELFYHCDVQHDYIAGGDMIFHVHWMPATATGGDVKWQIEYQWVEAGATWPAPTTLAGTTAAGTTAWADKRTDFTIPGAGHTYNSRIMVRLFRNPVDAADTYAGDAVLSSVGMHYQADPGQP